MIVAVVAAAAAAAAITVDFRQIAVRLHVVVAQHFELIELDQAGRNDMIFVLETVVSANQATN